MYRQRFIQHIGEGKPVIYVTRRLVILGVQVQSTMTVVKQDIILGGARQFGGEVSL